MAGFVMSAISPIDAEIDELIKQVPIWRNEISSGKGTVGHLAKQLHLSNYLGGKSTGSVAQDLATGALGAGEFLLGAVSDFLIVVVLTIYFLAALPAIKNFCSHLVPESRRRRFVLLSDAASWPA